MRKFISGLAILANLFTPLSGQITGSFKAGFSDYRGDLHCLADDNINFLDNLKGSVGLGVRIPISASTGFRVEGTYFKIAGNEADFSDPGHAARGWSFKNDIVELSGLLDWELLGKRRFSNPEKRFQRILTPVIFVGAGAVFNNPKVDFNNQQNQEISEDLDAANKVRIALPLGFGLKYYFSESFALAAESGIRLPVSDYYDGVSKATGTDGADSYGFAGIKAYFTFGAKPDFDGDGVPDKKDKCPEFPGLISLEGCPDRDNDSVADHKDKCPDLFGPAELNGCPDTDGDGLVDTEDDCPQVPGGVLFKGCPDSDGDGISDILDDCPNTPGIRSMLGCPDTDGDGIVDSEDDCPNEPGVASDNGCPDLDSDDDGIKDRLDDCPDEKGPEELDGCPDSDSDGIADKNDDCPNEKGEAPTGCPVPKPVVKIPPKLGMENIRRRLAFATQNIRFSSNSANIVPESFAVLEDVVNILLNFPAIKLSINGYTDNRGNEEFNRLLSQRRAKSVFDYFTNAGINAGRLGYFGFGEANPIANNETEEGRRMNRRVDFVLE